MTSVDWASAASPDAPNEDDRRPGEQPPQRRTRRTRAQMEADGDRPASGGTGSRGASAKSIESTIGAAIATANMFYTMLAPAEYKHLALQEANDVGDLAAAPVVSSDGKPHEIEALAKALAAEVNASASLKKWIGRASKASPHIGLAVVLFSIAAPRLIALGLLPNVFAFSQASENAVPVEAGGTPDGHWAYRDGQIDPTYVPDSASAG